MPAQVPISGIDAEVQGAEAAIEQNFAESVLAIYTSALYWGIV